MNFIVTEKGVIKVADQSIVLLEVFSTSLLEDIQSNTEATLIVPDDLKYVDINL